ncbi:MAG: glycosyltransferase family 39 protein [Anaerolineaceae bacterium]|nr:glycosyltransferase family 39 protein [Anaerolineaceae bacterium]
MEVRNQFDSHQRAFNLSLCAAALATLFCTFELLRIPSDSKNAFFLGLSKERLLMLSGFCFLFVLNIICLLQREKLRSILEKNGKAKPFVIFALLTTLFLLLMPDYRFNKAAAYYSRLKPYILWVFLNTLIYWIYLTYTQNNFRELKETFSNLIKQKYYILPMLLIFCGGILFVEISGLGKTAEISLWNKNGIPLQSIQLFLSLMVFSIVWKCGLFTRIGKKKLLNFFIIWAVSALIWSLAPMEDHFFAPGPYPPDGQFYPYSDAFNYDFSAQTALHGWGFNLRRTFLKPTLAFITFLSHLLSGNDINKSMMIQSASFGILPAIIYLFGNAIGGNACGWLGAAFSIMKEWNALRTRTVMTINSRLFMSEFLTQILLAAFCYALFRWIKKNNKESLYAILAGGIFTLGFFTRYNFAAFLPAALLLLFIAYRRQFLRLLKTVALFLLTITLTAGPLLYREKDVSWGLLQELSYTTQYILFKDRLSNPTPENPVETPISESSSISNDFENSDFNTKKNQTQFKTVEKNTSAFGSKEISKKTSVSEINKDFLKLVKKDFNTAQITQKLKNKNSTTILPVLPSIINHGLHNFIASFLTLPMDISFQDLEHLYIQEGSGLWQDNWQGDFNTGQWVLIGVWTILGAICTGMLIKEHGLAGFSLPYFWMVYSFSVGFSRSSGGRYVVPTNWIPMLLLAYCITLFFSKGKIIRNPEEKTISVIPVWQPVVAMLGFCSFFTALYLFENHMPTTITTSEEGDLAILQERLYDHDEIDWELIKAQQSQGILHITHGVVVYPRFYFFRDGENTKEDLLMWKDYSRLTFNGINFEGTWNSMLSQGYLLPHTNLIENFPHDSVFRAVSCKSDYGYEDVLAVTIETKKGEVFTYVRDPLPAFSCPVPEPVCYSLENCR